MSKLEQVLSNTKKDYGEGSVIILKDRSSLATNIVSTGFIGLDTILGGGIPRGRMIEISGNEAVGKTTLALQIAVDINKAGGECLFIDLENSAFTPYLDTLGIDENRFGISQPSSATEALSIAETAIRANMDLVIIDSVSALLTAQESDGDYGDATMASVARFMGPACRKIIPILTNSSSILLWINQVRDKFGNFTGGTITTGGKALRYYTTQRLDLSYIGLLKDGEEVIGSRVRVKTIKNKISRPFQVIEEDMIFGSGFCKQGEIIDIALEKKLINKAGSWYSYGDMKLGQGRESVRSLLKEDVNLFNEIKAKL